MGLGWGWRERVQLQERGGNTAREVELEGMGCGGGEGEGCERRASSLEALLNMISQAQTISGATTLKVQGRAAQQGR